MYWTKTPSFIIRLFGSYVWRKKIADKKIVYLTFDDGPSAQVTDKLLKILSEKNVPATFFCLGKNIEDNPMLYKSIEEAGHCVGYHGWDHINGWKVSGKDFFDNACKGSNLVSSNLFRPPYGKVPIQFNHRLTKQFDVIMWDVMSGDFDEKISADKCLKNVVRNVQSGSIIVFHDNKKSAKKMLKVVPKVIDTLEESNYTFEKL